MRGASLPHGKFGPVGPVEICRLYTERVNEPGLNDRWDRWLPIAVGVVGALLSLAMWIFIIETREARLLRQTRDYAAESAAALRQEFEEQIDALSGLRRKWETFGLEARDEWEASADLWVDRISGLESLAWIEANGGRTRVALGRERTAAETELDLEGARVQTGRPAIVGPEPLESGGFGYRLFLPMRDDGRIAGTIVARFELEQLLAHVLYAHAKGYALETWWSETALYTRDEATDARWLDWWVHEQTVELPLGVRWTLRLRPTAELAKTQLTPLPHYLLGAGLVLSVVGAIVIRDLRVILRQSRALEIANRALAHRSDELEQAVAERTARLEDVIADLENFNRSVSHDLRSPIGAILNYCAILEEDYRGKVLDDEGMEMLERIRGSAERAIRLLSDLLSLSRAGHAAIESERVDMTQLAREAFQQAKAAEGEDEVGFVLGSLPEADGDPTLLGNVFTNLMTNALKYSRGVEGRAIRVEGRIENDEKIYEVHDNGQGFDPGYADKMFGLFERLHADDEIEGTGIGLAVVKQIVRRHGGRVWADGRPGEGARVGFSLPFRSRS